MNKIANKHEQKCVNYIANKPVILTRLVHDVPTFIPVLLAMTSCTLCYIKFWYHLIEELQEDFSILPPDKEYHAHIINKKFCPTKITYSVY